MIRFPTALSQVEGPGADSTLVVRAGGTDLGERRRLGLARGPLLDLRDLAELDLIEWEPTSGAAVLGAKVRIGVAAADDALARAYPGFCAAAGALATPQIRAVGTVGGNLLQANRWMPPLQPREQAAYFRTITRARSEWPLVEALVRLVVEEGTVRFARVAIGGVAPVPLRLPAVEAALVGGPIDSAAFARAAAIAKEGANPLPMTEYKVELVEGTVLETLERASHAAVLTVVAAEGGV